MIKTFTMFSLSWVSTFFYGYPWLNLVLYCLIPKSVIMMGWRWSKLNSHSVYAFAHTTHTLPLLMQYIRTVTTLLHNLLHYSLFMSTLQYSIPQYHILYYDISFYIHNIVFIYLNRPTLYFCSVKCLISHFLAWWSFCT